MSETIQIITNITISDKAPKKAIDELVKFRQDVDRYKALIISVYKSKNN